MAQSPITRTGRRTSIRSSGAKSSASQPVGAEKIAAQAVAVAGVGSFAELAALSLARRFARTGRLQDARKLLARYLERHEATEAVVGALRALSRAS